METTLSRTLRLETVMCLRPNLWQRLATISISVCMRSVYLAKVQASILRCLVKTLKSTVQ